MHDVFCGDAADPGHLTVDLHLRPEEAVDLFKVDAPDVGQDDDALAPPPLHDLELDLASAAPALGVAFAQERDDAAHHAAVVVGYDVADAAQEREEIITRFLRFTFDALVGVEDLARVAVRLPSITNRRTE